MTETATQHDLSAQIVAMLADPGSYADVTGAVEKIETHISWVFRTDRFVYKLKKPVRFEFVDFSTMEARKAACEEEVRLNRRLSHNVYLGVVPITREGDRLMLNGSGPAVDYVVWMRRLPDDRVLDRLIRCNLLEEADIRSVSDLLMAFYVQLPAVERAPDDYCRQLLDLCLANRADLLEHAHPNCAQSIKRIHSAQLLYLAVEEDLFCDRVRRGRIVDGHGDLRAEHIYLESPPSIIDCVEFSRELREVDVLDELCFLAMDCRRLGDVEVGDRLLGAYADATGEQPPDALVAFYMSYRASVRAKVATLRAEQAETPAKKAFLRQVRQYLDWADHYAQQLPPPVLVTVGGLMGSGKSTLATELARVLGAELLSTDRLRKSHFGSSTTPAAYGEGIYQPASRQTVYDEMLARASESLDDGCSVVLDGTFLTNALRTAAVKCGRRHGASPIVVECDCPQDVALERIRRRAASGGGDSEARPELYALQAQEHEPLAPELPAVRVEATLPPSEQCHVVRRALREVMLRGDRSVVGV